MKSYRSVKAIKYIHKYIYKRLNQATAKVAKIDEFIQHMNDWYIDSIKVI